MSGQKMPLYLLEQGLQEVMRHTVLMLGSETQSSTGPVLLTTEQSSQTSMPVLISLCLHHA